ncbi:MAG: hypothetical protein ABI690_31950 [Chloroflexota bacterium]
MKNKLTVISLLVIVICFIVAMGLFLWNRAYPDIPTCFDNSPDLQSYRSTPSAKTTTDFMKTPQISVANIENLVELHSFETPDNHVSTLAISSDNTFVVTSYTNQSPKIFDLESGGTTPVSDVKSVESIAISPDNKLLAFYNYEGNIALWDIPRRTLIASWDVGHTSNTNTVQFSSKGDLIFSSGKSVYLCNFASKKNQKLFDNISQARLADIIFNSRQNNLVYSTTGDNDSGGRAEIGIWNFDSPDNRQSFDLNKSNTLINAIAVSLDGRRIASVSTDDSVNFIDTQTGMILPTIAIKNSSSPTNNDYDIALNMDGSLMVIGNRPDVGYRTKGEKGHLAFWDVNKRSLIQTIDAHAQEITSLIFDTTGNLIISGSLDGTVKVWGIKSP